MKEESQSNQKLIELYGAYPEIGEAKKKLMKEREEFEMRESLIWRRLKISTYLDFTKFFLSLSE